MRERVRGAEGAVKPVCSEEPELTIMPSRLSDRVAARNSSSVPQRFGAHRKVSPKAGGSRDDVLHERRWRYRDLETILSIYSQEGVRLVPGVLLRGQGGYNP